MKTVAPGALTWFLIILATCLILFLFQKILWLIIPLMLALVSYYCLHPLVSALVIQGLRHGSAVRIIVAILLAISFGSAVLVGPRFVSHARDWQATADRYVQGGQALLQRIILALEQDSPRLQRIGLSEKLDQQTARFNEEFTSKYLASITIGILEWTPSLLLAPYLTYFLLKDGNRFKRFLIQSVPNAFFEKTLILFEKLDESLQSFFQGLIALTVLDTIFLGAGLWLLGISNALLLACVAAVLAWLPYIGSAIGCILVVLVAATDFPDQAWIASGCFGLFIAVRLLDDFIFLPLTIGRKLHIHPVLSVLMLFLGAAVAGASGLFLALPVLGVVAVAGEIVAQVVTDTRLRARFRQARMLAAEHPAIRWS